MNCSENFRIQKINKMSSDEGTFLMYTAIENNDLINLRELLESGHDPEAYAVEYGGYLLTKSLLHIACEKDRPECAQIMLEYGASPRLRDKWGMTPLMYSVIGHDLVFMKILLEKDPGHIDETDMKFMTALHYAAEEGSDEMVRLLLSYGADVHLRTARIGHTPLMEACKRGAGHSENRSNHIKCIQTLINAGSDLEVADYRYKRTALQLAVLAKDAAVLEILLQAGADPNSLDRGGRTALTNCLLESVIVPRAPGSAPIISDEVLSMIILLTQAGTNMNLSLCEYSHPLICASFVGSLQLVNFFMDNGSSPELASSCFPSGVTPILTAVSRNQTNIVKHFIGWGCKINQKGRISRKQMDYIFDCFELAIFLKYWDLAKLLLNTGYRWKPNQIDKDNDLRESLQSSEEMTEWYNSYIRTPQSLMFYSIVTIRESLGSNIPSKYEKLQLPKSINNKILLKELLSVDES